MNIDDYLTENEEIRLQWDGKIKSGLSTVSRGAVIFAATNSRLLVVTNSGSSKDIEYSHISSVEVETKPSYNPTFEQTGLIIGFLAITTGPIAFVASNTNLQALIFLLYISSGVYLLKSNWGDFAGVGDLFDFEKEKVYKITLITGDEEDNEISFQTEENIGAELSRIVRESN